jgi:hypothetical protein
MIKLLKPAMAAAPMDAKLFLGSLRRFGQAKLLAVVVAAALSFGIITTTAQAAPYGSCNYSANAYSSDAACQTTSTSSNSGSLSSTGQNYLRLLYAAIGLLVFAGGMLVVFRIISKNRSADPVG